MVGVFGYADVEGVVGAFEDVAVEHGVPSASGRIVDQYLSLTGRAAVGVASTWTRSWCPSQVRLGTPYPCRIWWRREELEYSRG